MIEAQYWIVEPLREQDHDLPEDMTAQTSSETYKRIIGYNAHDRSLALEDLRRLQNRNPNAVLLTFDPRKRVFEVIEGQQARTLAGRK